MSARTPPIRDRARRAAESDGTARAMPDRRGETPSRPPPGPFWPRRPRRSCIQRSNGLPVGREAAVVQAGVVAVQRLLRTIARAHQRPGDALQKTFGKRAFAIAVKFPGRHEALYGQVIDRGAQILA